MLDISWFTVWILLTAILVVGEIFTAGFFLLPFGIGAAAAAMVSWGGAGLAWQWTVFLVVSVAMLLLLKRFSDRVTEGAVPLRVAADRMIGRVGSVIETLQPHGVTGRVRVGSEEWRAAPDGEEAIVAGSAVEVVRVDGTHLVVRPRGGASPDQGGGS